jgi:hypothetical protein
VPGFISANFRLNLNRSQVVNYAQWQNREALRDPLHLMFERLISAGEQPGMRQALRPSFA